VLFDAKIGVLARKMTEKALELGGSYYLPYRPYQTREQFQRAYPRWNEFKAIKQKYDPNGRFNNNFGARYLK
jgi:FAD/FMN-containing dehydrogenase